MRSKVYLVILHFYYSYIVRFWKKKVFFTLEVYSVVRDPMFVTV